MEINNYFQLFIAFVAILIVVAVIWFALTAFGIIGKKEEVVIEEPSPPDLGELTTAYGLDVHAKCLSQYQDFIDNNGQDYSGCLADFNFNDRYCGGFDPETQALSDENVVVILDASGSMSQTTYAGSRIDIAKEAVSDFLTKMPANVNTGLIVYGHKGSNYLSEKELSCQGIEEVVKLGSNNSSNIISAMNSFSPKGWTPIAGSLEFAKDIFSGRSEKDKDYLILVSDGAESCDGDPVLAAGELKSEIKGVKLSVIGFDPDYITREFLTKVAKVGGGTYVDAFSSEEIARAFNDQFLLIQKDCVSVTLIEMFLKYNKSNLDNLNCWMDASKKEMEDLNNLFAQNPDDTSCNQEISDIITARQKEFFNQKQALEEENDKIYEKIRADLNSQLKALGG